jgi:D-alanine--poly(phosphoribitol) ligase subunit 2
MAIADTLTDRITIMLERTLHVRVPSPDVDLLDSGLLDSMSFVGLLLGIEREFGVAVALEDVDLEHFRSVHAIATFVASRT